MSQLDSRKKVVMTKRGRKPKELTNADILRAMALLLEGNVCKSVRAAASAAIDQLSYPLDGASRSSVVDRLRRAFGKQKNDLRTWARADLEQKKRRTAKAKPSRSSSPQGSVSSDTLASAVDDLTILDQMMGRDSAVEAALEHMRINEAAAGLTRSLQAVTAHHEIMNRAIRDYDVMNRALREYDEIGRAFREYDEMNRAIYGPFGRRRGR